jgi:glycerate kinase
MKIVIAPDSYKESLSAAQVADIIEAGMREVFPAAEYVKLPVADGGEGTVDAMVDAFQGRRLSVMVPDPLGKQVQAGYGLSGDGSLAIIEMAAASGLALVPPALRDPRVTSTEGTGELIRAALDAGARNLILGIGGSATNDGGSGMLRALGVRFLDAAGHDLPAGGAALSQLAGIDVSGLDPRLAKCVINVACDVNNPLTGENGASATFGPQKGATPEMIRELDAALHHYAEVIRMQLGQDVEHLPGSGAAGGMGAAMVAFTPARLRPGSEIVMDAVKLDAAVADADLVITGEGRIDSQTIRGKTPHGVATVAKRYGKPVIGIAGCLTPDVSVVHKHGIDAVFSVLDSACTVEQALAAAADNLRRAARNVAAVLAIGQHIRS